MLTTKFQKIAHMEIPVDRMYTDPHDVILTKS